MGKRPSWLSEYVADAINEAIHQNYRLREPLVSMLIKCEMQIELARIEASRASGSDRYVKLAAETLRGVVE